MKDEGSENNKVIVLCKKEHLSGTVYERSQAHGRGISEAQNSKVSSRHTLISPKFE